MYQIYEDEVNTDIVGKDIKPDIIKLLSENGYTIAQTRALFNSIVEQFERYMPVTDNKQN